MSKEAMKLALEALKQIDEAMPFPVAKLAQSALREALAEQKSGIKQVIELYDSPDQPAQQEPVAWYVERQHIGFRDHGLKLGPFWELSEAEEWTNCVHILKPLYTSPPAQRTWVGLTGSEITTSPPYSVTRDKGCFHAGALWAEAKLKEKNT